MKAACRRWQQAVTAVAVACVVGLLLDGPLAARAQEKPVGPEKLQKSQNTAQTEEGNEEGDDDLLFPLKREQWFVQQRAYPNTHIPAGAYWRAQMQRRALVAKRANRLAMARMTSRQLAAQADPFASATWTAAGPQPAAAYYGSIVYSGRATSIAVNPTDPNTAYLGTAGGGVWKTTDGGQTWNPLTDSQASLAIGAVAVDPNNPSTVFAGTGEADFSGDSYYGEGLLKSTDAGSTWTLVQTPFLNGNTTGSFASIAVQPGNSNVVLAGNVGVSNSGLWRSADGGTTWTEVLAPGGYAGVTAVMFDVKNSSIAYAGIGGYYPTSAGSVYMSTDSGQTWTPIDGSGAGTIPTPANVFRTALAESADGTTLYAAFANSSLTAPGLIYSTTNKGTSWTQLATPSPDGIDWYRDSIAVSPTNPQVLYAAGIGLYESTDGGQTWVKNTGGVLYADQHSIVFSADGSRLYVADDGGIFSSTAPTVASATFASLNSSINTMTFYPGFSLSPTTSNWLLAGSQDHGLNLYTGSVAWQNGEQSGFCGDGGSVYIDPKGTYAYAHCKGGSADWTANATADASVTSWVAAQTGISTTDREPWVADIKGDQQTVSTVYTVTDRLYQSVNNAASWTAISGDLTAGQSTLTTIGISPTNGNTIYTGAGDGTVSVTTNALSGTSSTWTMLSGLPDRSISKIVVEPDSTQDVYVAVNGFGAGHVFHSTDGGSSWTDISGDLPDTPADSILVDPDLNDTIYLATDTGVYVTTNAGTNWEPLGQGLPNVVVQDLLLDESTRTLWVITHGRGAWETTLPLAGLAASNTSLSFSNQTQGTTSTAQNVTLTNNLASTTLSITAIQITGPFTQTNNCGASLAAGASCTVNVSFAPTTAGSAQGTLTVTSSSNTAVVSLTGTGVGIPDVALDSSSLAFSSQAVGVASASQTVQLSNTGDGALTNIAVSFSGTNAGDFSQTNNCSTSLAAGADCSINVVFTPGATGARTASLSIADDAPNAPQVVSLSGTGAAPFTVTAASSSATVSAGSSASYTLTVAAAKGTSLASSVSLTCSGLPTGSACAFSPTSVASGATSQAVTLSISTTGASASLGTDTAGGMALAGISLLGLLLLLPARRRRVGLLMLALICVALSGCSGGGNSNSSSTGSGSGSGGGTGGSSGTPAGAYTVTVTSAQSNVYSTTTKLTLTVQ